MHAINTSDDAVTAEDLLSPMFRQCSWLLTTYLPNGTRCDTRRFELTIEWGKLMFTAFCEGFVQTWRITGFDLLPGRISLLARRGIARLPVTLTLYQTGLVGPEDAGQRRTEYLEMIRQLLNAYDPQTVIRAGSVAGIRRRNIRGGYARLVLHHSGSRVLVLGVSGSENQQLINDIPEAGLTWISRYNGDRVPSGQARELWFLLPAGRDRTAIERLTLMTAKHLDVRIRGFSVDEEKRSIVAMEIAAQMELLSRHPRRLIWPRREEDEGESGLLRARIVALAADLIEVRSAIGRRGERFMIHGLEFACWAHGGPSRISFGISDRVKLTVENFYLLEELVRRISRYRRADARDRRHQLYRLRAEAWLESTIRRDIRRFDPALDDRYVYCQVPTWRADERSVLDILAVEKGGRLVVIELKAGEDAMLPLQGLDYWLRVKESLERHEFQHRGLFEGVKLSHESPLLYLVTPRLRFHRTFSEVGRCLAPEIEAYRIGLNSNWRSGLRVQVRERIN